MKIYESKPAHFPTVTRVVVVDEKGLVMERWKLDNVVITFQDDNRTLKVFINSDQKFVDESCFKAEPS